MLSLECVSQHAVLKENYAKLPAPQHASTSHTTDFYSVVEFVMTLTLSIGHLPFTFPLLQRGFVAFFVISFLNPHIDQSQKSENKVL